MGTDCSLNGESLDRWYVFSDEFDCGWVYTREEFLEKCGILLNNLDEEEFDYRDKKYHEYWIRKAIENVKDLNTITPDYWDDYVNYEDNFNWDIYLSTKYKKQNENNK